MRQHLTNLLNADFYFRRDARYPLVDLEAVKLLNAKYFPLASETSVVLKKSKSTRNNTVPFGPAKDKYDGYHQRFIDFLQRDNPNVLLALETYPDNLVLAGGILASLFAADEDEPFGALHHNFPLDYDLFIVADSAEKAEEIILGVAKILESRANFAFIGFEPNITVVFHPDVVTWHYLGGKKVQVVRRVYPRKDLIIGGFDLWASQIMWTPTCSFEFTPMGAFAAATLCFPEDCSKRSLSAAFRRNKYVLKGYTIVFLGCQREEMPKMDADFFHVDYKYQHERNRQLASKVTYNTIRSAIGHPLKPEEMKVPYMVLAPNENYEYTRLELRDYGEERNDLHLTAEAQDGPDGLERLQRLLGEAREVRTLTLKRYADVYDIKDDDVLNSVFGNYCSIFSNGGHLKRFNHETFRRVLGEDNHELWAQWCNAYYFERTYDVAELMWRERLLSKCIGVREKFQNVSDMWRVNNPEAQTFGQNYPTPCHPRDFYGPGYVPTYVGIPHHTYWGLKQIFLEGQNALRLKLPRDIFRLVLKILFKEICLDRLDELFRV